MKITNQNTISKTQIDELTIGLKNGNEIVVSRITHYEEKGFQDKISWSILDGEKHYQALTSEQKSKLDDLIIHAK